MGEVIKITINNQMQTLSVKEYKNLRVVTFRDIDEVHQRPEGTARKRFNDNREHFVEGEDYFEVNQPAEMRTLGFERPQGGFPEKVILVAESGYLMLVKSFTDDLAWQVQKKLVDGYFRAKSLAQGYKLPRTFLEALKELVRSEEEKQELQEQLQLQAPKVEMYDILLSAKNAQTMNEVAKALGWGRNKLFAFLRDNEVLMKNNLPYQRYLDAGYFEVREVTTQRGDLAVNVTQTLVAPKGMDFIGRLVRSKSIAV